MVGGFGLTEVVAGGDFNDALEGAVIDFHDEKFAFGGATTIWAMPGNLDAAAFEPTNDFQQLANAVFQKHCELPDRRIIPSPHRLKIGGGSFAETHRIVPGGFRNRAVSNPAGKSELSSANIRVMGIFVNFRKQNRAVLE